eukprot:363350-Chlamydomonas_euryale.AAC.5
MHAFHVQSRSGSGLQGYRHMPCRHSKAVRARAARLPAGTPQALESCRGQGGRAAPPYAMRHTQPQGQHPFRSPCDGTASASCAVPVVLARKASHPQTPTPLLALQCARGQQSASSRTTVTACGGRLRSWICTLGRGSCPTHWRRRQPSAPHALAAGGAPSARPRTWCTPMA